jgi:hypothetical protein
MALSTRWPTRSIESIHASTSARSSGTSSGQMFGPCNGSGSGGSSRPK